MKEVDILLIEDNIADADLTLRALKHENKNYDILHLEDGAEALDYIFSIGDYREKVREGMPKLILMDLQLPKVGGKEVLRRIKWDEQTRLIPVIILTSSDHQKDVLECYKLGANAYMVKPLDFEEYIQQVSKALDFWLGVNYLPNF